MKAKKLMFGLMACMLLVAVSCEPNSTAQEDDLYEIGVRRGDITVDNKGNN